MIDRRFQMKSPATQVILMTGGNIGNEEEAICQERNILVLRKPFLGTDVVNMVRARLFMSPPYNLSGTASGTWKRASGKRQQGRKDFREPPGNPC